MGFQTEINTVLKLKPEQGLHEKDLAVHKEYPFSKDGHRIYPLEVPLDLVNDQWGVVAKIMVTSYSVGKGKTKGTYKILKIYDDSERKMLSKLIMR